MTKATIMHHISFSLMPCPIARGLDRVGAWWNILILRDAFRGMTRFGQFQKSLGIAPNILSRRLLGLVEAGLLEKRRYTEQPPRDEYVLTLCGRGFHPVLRAMLVWGNTHFMPEGKAVVLEDSTTGLPAEPVMIEANSGKPMDQERVQAVRRHTEAGRQP